MKKKVYSLSVAILMLLITSFVGASTLVENEDISANGSEVDYDNIKLEVIIKNNSKYCWILEPIEIKINIINTADKLINLTFKGFQYYDFIVKNEKGEKIYKWSDENNYSGEEKISLFPPNSSKNLNTRWWQKGRRLSFMPYRPIRPGKYDITVFIPAKEKCYQANFSVNIVRWYKYFDW